MEDGLLEFPCDIPVKVMGRNTSEFRDEAAHVVSQHFPNAAATEQESRNSRFVSLTFTVHAESRESIDALYKDLTHNEQVIMVL